MDDDFGFGGINTKIKLKDLDKIVDDILLTSYKSEKDDKHVLFLVERPLKKALTGALSTWVRKNFPGFSYDIVTASILSTSEEDIKKQGIFRFYKKAQSDFKKYLIPDKTIVVSMGMAINAITLSSDLSVECFYDYVFNKTYFYSPEVDSHVFPIDGTDMLFTNEAGFWAPKDSSRVQFALYQFQQIKSKYQDLREPPAFRKPTIVTIDTPQKWEGFYQKFKNTSGIIAWDTETSGFHHIRDRLGCFTCTFDGKTGYFVSWEVAIPEQLNEILSSKTQVLQNGKFDCKFAKQNGVTKAYIDQDTLHLAHSLNEMRFNSLKSLAYYYTPYGGYDMALEDYKDRYNPESYIDIPMPILREYATMDTIVTYLANKAMQEQVDYIDSNFPPIHENGWSVRKLYETVIIPAVNKFVDMEMHGVSVNMEIWEKNAKILQGHIDECKANLNQIFGIEDDDLFQGLVDEEEDEEPSKKSMLQSTMKLGKLLEKLNWEDFGRSKSGHYLTGDEQLVRWVNLGHKGAKELQTLRSLLTMQKTFMGNPGSMTTGWKRYVIKHGENDFRIHSNYSVMMMDTYRNGCRDPNFQQVPSGALHANLFKEIFSVPQNDVNKYLIVNLDYASFQLRLSALDQGETGDFLYKKYLADPNVDLHSVTGFNVFSKGVEYIFVDIGDGVEHVFTENEMVKIIRDGNEISVKAGELRETDKLL